MNARTYIHSLPNAPIPLDPYSHTLIDLKNNLNEYLTNKITLCSLAEFVILAYTNTEFFENSFQVNTWVNLNSSIMNNVVYNFSPNWNSVYSTFNSNSASYMSKTYNDSKYFAISGGIITGDVGISGHLYANTFGASNFQPATTLGTVVGKIQIFNASKVSVGYIPVYDNIT
jgi:hypothetical protein